MDLIPPARVHRDHEGARHSVGTTDKERFHGCGLWSRGTYVDRETQATRKKEKNGVMGTVCSKMYEIKTKGEVFLAGLVRKSLLEM
jgi:hypothetical protein